MIWKQHDPAQKDACVYLASTASGERIYIARDVVDADFLISVGPIGFDPLMGYRGTNSVFYPGLSSAAAMQRANGQGHLELGPDEVRPLRELVDEVGWLLGNPFTIQVIPAASRGVSRVLAGVCDSVFAQGKKLLSEQWLVQVDERPEVVIAAIDDDGGPHGWEQLGAAVEVARNWWRTAARSSCFPSSRRNCRRGWNCSVPARGARDAIRPLRKQAAPDMIYATQLASAADSGAVYLLSGVPDDVVDELFLAPVANETEIRRLLGDDSRCLFLEAAEFVHGTVRAA